jgi:peptidoglycan/LPS O-acetylase OafA/YrhL
MSKGANRDEYLDSLRGIAAMIVVIAHFFGVFYPFSLFGQSELHPEHEAWEGFMHSTPLGIIAAGQFAVCFFFILSGYVLSYRYLGEEGERSRLIGTIVKRPVRLGGVVLSTMLIGWLLIISGQIYSKPVAEITHSTWFSQYWTGEFPAARFLRQLLVSPFASGAEYDPPLWTIDLELYGSFLTFGYLLVFGHSRYRWISQLALLFLAKRYRMQGFVLGLMLADLKKNYPASPIHPLAVRAVPLLFPVGLLLASFPHYLAAEDLRNTLYGAFPTLRGLNGGYSMLGALLVFVAALNCPRCAEFLNRKPMRFLGSISYALYAIHFLVLGSFSSWLFLRIHSSMPYSLAVLVIVLVSMPVNLLLSWWITKYIDTVAIAASDRLGKFVSKQARGILSRARAARVRWVVGQIERRDVR